MKTKTMTQKSIYLFSLIVLFFLGSTSQSFAQHFCGTINKAESINLSEEELKTSYQDRFGNIYSETYFKDAIAKLSDYKSPINTGYFNLSFNNFPETIEAPGHPNFGQDIRPTICQVFADLSEMIDQRTHTLSCGDVISPQTVNILVRSNVCGDDPNCDNATSQVAGTASPLYSFLDYFDLDGDCFPVAESVFWKKMNANESFFPLGFDALMDINVDNINFNYQLDQSIPVASDKLDLYSIALHEALHIFGFASRMSSSGEPIDAQFTPTDYYSRFDQFLHITENFVPNEASENTERLVAGDCGVNCFSLNSLVNDFDELVQNSCGAAEYDIVFGDSGIAAVYGGNNNELDIINGLSHLREDCNGSTSDFVMDPFISNGDDERTISDEELKILCKLGYKINDSAPLACDGCFAYATIDHTQSVASQITIEYFESCCYEPFLAKINDTLVFNIDHLLCNDFSNGDIEVTDVYYDNTWWGDGKLTELPNGLYEFIGTNPGIHRVNYTISGCDCYVSTSYFDIIVSRGLEDCNETKCDNLVCIGDFESINKTNDFYFESCKEDLFYMEGADQNTPDICESANNKYLDLVNIIGPEATLIELDYPLLPGCTMEISMDLATRGDNDPGQLNLYGSSTKPCHPSEVFIKQDCNDSEIITVDNICENYSYQPFCILTDELITNTFSGGLTLCPNSAVDFQNYSWSVKNDFGEEISYIVLYNKTQPSVIWLDNIDIRSVCPPELITNFSDVVSEENEVVLIDVEVCFGEESYQGFESTDVNIYVQLPPNVNYAIGGDFVNGVATISDLEAGECITLQLAVQSSIIGIYEMMYQVVVPDLCKSEQLVSELEIKEKTSVKELNLEEIPESATFYIVDILGQAQKIEKVKSLADFAKDDLENRISGIYILQIVNEGETIYTKKIIHLAN